MTTSLKSLTRRLLLPGSWGHLESTLVAGAPSRIVNVASLSQRPIDFDNVMLEREYDAGRAYGQSKLAQIMFTQDLAEELAVKEAIQHGTLTEDDHLEARASNFLAALAMVRHGEADFALAWADGTIHAQEAAAIRRARRRLRAAMRCALTSATAPPGTTIPAQRKKLLAVLGHIVTDFEPGVFYPEKEVNEILARYHEDTASLRRELVGARLMDRKEGVYWRMEDGTRELVRRGHRYAAPSAGRSALPRRTVATSRRRANSGRRPTRTCTGGSKVSS